MKDLAVMYHYVREKEMFNGSVPIEPKEFSQQVAYGKTFFNVAPPKDCKSYENNFLITFDDATRDQYTNAYKIMEAQGVKGYFAVMSGPLVQGVIPIFHLVHAILSEIEDEELWEDIKINFEIPSNLKALSIIYDYEQNIYRRYNKYILNFLLNEKECRSYLEKKLIKLYGSLNRFISEFYIQPHEIIAMHQNGMEIGVHCVHHRPYSGDAQTFYDEEIAPCKQYLTLLLGEEPKWYTPAFGGGENMTAMIKDLTPILKAEGFIGGFTTIEGFCDIGSDGFWHNRVDCNKLEIFLKQTNLLNKELTIET